jgi:predicted dehydrogenase
MTSREIRIAFVGAGNMTREHARAFGGIEGVVLSGIFSRTRARAETLASELGVQTVFDSIAEMYAQTKADLVVVSVPELSTRDVCMEAFRYDWKLLIEKPAGCDLREAREIAAACRAAGRVRIRCAEPQALQQHSSDHSRP